MQETTYANEIYLCFDREISDDETNKWHNKFCKKFDYEFDDFIQVDEPELNEYAAILLINTKCQDMILCKDFLESLTQGTAFKKFSNVCKK